jgi:phosphomannomutase
MTRDFRLDPSVLREYDIRGIIGKTLTAEGYEAIGKAFGTGLGREGGRSVAVGYDGRLTSPDLEKALVSGLASTGATVYRIGLGPSPMLYFAVQHLKADGGMMITGSHNPPEYNGIKMSRRGRPFFGNDIRTLGEMIARRDFDVGKGCAEDHPVAEAYVARLVADFEAGTKLTVAWDPGNGAAGRVLGMMCAKLPGEHILINDAVDGRFPAHHPDPTVPENLEQLRETVIASA